MQDVQSAREDYAEAIRKSLSSNKGLSTAFNKGVTSAKVTAKETVARWGSKKADGGLPWTVYKAVCKRHGKHVSLGGQEYDFNMDL